ncbi:ATPase, AAA family protein [Ditylenchus destructor]|uniref:ATPase, AAA family protein n=1 Tax=Ditylenchus destructor TaxID=166010 RepID=A0AAD4R9D1_9BILA|nr:ATPase, AAA family protein [Ditylenchus destructor]
MSSKKKKPVIHCSSCGCYYLSKDFEKHAGFESNAPSPRSAPKGSTQKMRADGNANINNVLKCTKVSFVESEIPVIEPKEGMVGFSQAVEKRESLLPAESLGWIKYQTVLINPETLNQLESLPRSVALLQQICGANDGQRELVQPQLVLLWPCDQVSPLRIVLPFGSSNQSGNLFSLSLVPSYETVRSASLILLNHAELASDLLQLLSNPSLHLTAYLRAYLSNAFACPGLPIAVYYYGKKLKFALNEEEKTQTESETLVEGMKELTMKHHKKIYKFAFDATYNVIWEPDDMR